MISLILNKARIFKVGEIVHFKVKSVYMQAPGKWRLEVEDVTPLSGAKQEKVLNAVSPSVRREGLGKISE